MLTNEEQRADRCELCRFYHVAWLYEDYECRRHSPTVKLVLSTDPNRGNMRAWPGVRPTDWCGDFQAV